MEKMDWKVPFVWGCAFSLAAGAFVNYLANKKKIDFANAYPIVIETQEFMGDTDAPEINATEKNQINAYLALYGDKYTFAKDSDVESEEFITRYVNESATALGCGFQIEFRGEGELYFSDVEPDMPAALSGIMRGDKVVSVDGVKISDYVSAKELLGKEGTTVVLQLERDGQIIGLSFDRVSDKLAASGLSYKMYGDTLYVQHTSFSKNALTGFKEILESSEFDSLIIDLRGNGGGNTSEAVSTADLFVPAGKQVTSYHYNGSVDALATSDEPTYTVPIVLLVNGDTASSAEIFTGLLKQYSDTTIVGETTFGKGIFQEYGTLRGCSVQFTAGYYTVGDWKCYHGYGIEPDVEVKMETGLIGTELDTQLEKALEIIG